MMNVVSSCKGWLKLLVSGCLAICIGSLAASAGAEQQDKASATPLFRITVRDAATSRGIPCVRVRLDRMVEYWTDSAGVAAIWEPDLTGKKVSVIADSPGYHMRRERGQRWRGMTPVLAAGGSATIVMERDNVAERLYRVTGSGIYRDSMMLGDKVPPTHDEAESLVTGQDTVNTITYKGKLLWLWGDTNLSDRRLGNFRTTCAYSDLPGKGGLDPEVGVDLKYIRQNGDIKPMTDIERRVIWLMGMRYGKDRKGTEHLYADYAKVMGYLNIVERGLVEFDSAKEEFVKVCVLPNDAAIVPGGIPFRAGGKDGEYYYYPSFWPSVRSRTDAESIKSLATYEAFTCLKQGERFNGSAGQLDRDKDGRLRWGWKKNTSPMDERALGQLVASGAMRPEEQWYRLRSTETTETLLSHAGNIVWNKYRQRWVAIRSQNFGKTVLGEVWYFEADAPMGPWVYGQKVVTHDMREYPYTFYNPAQHPEFEKDGGRTIFFEGTYTQEFSGGPSQTPRYNYNQIMYKLDLADKRLFLPVPVYRVGTKDSAYRTKLNVPKGKVETEIAFFAPDRQRAGTVPVFETRDANGKVALSTTSGAARDAVVFYALPTGDTANTTWTLPLYQFTHAKSGKHLYGTKDAVKDKGFTRDAMPVCRVWENPLLLNPQNL